MDTTPAFDVDRMRLDTLVKVSVLGVITDSDTELWVDGEMDSKRGTAIGVIAEVIQ